ncbi:hypothetical protein ACIBP6_39610 [Nonomuraea terrae]|uniref:hypothetical protein n=1 Tax=Nonomuraea terrae TaxID=2530383 RepID=UPI0037AA5BF5
MDVVKDMGLPGLHFHDLRHTGNMLAAMSGAGLKDLMARMGHDNVRAAMIYQHAVRGADQAITNAIDQQLKQDDDDGSSEALAPVGQLHVSCTEDREQHRKRSKPDRESIPDLAFVLRAGDGNRTRAVSLGTLSRLWTRTGKTPT